MHSQAGDGDGRIAVVSNSSRRARDRAARLRVVVRVEPLEGRLLLSGTPPTAANDTFATPVGVALNVPAPGVLGNDTDPENDSLTAAIVGMPTSGTVALNANGSFLYTPNGGFRGVDTFTYKANDGSNDSNTATVTITVDTPPAATNDSYSTAEDTPLMVALPGVLANDTDADGDMLTAVLVSTPTHGSLTLNSDGSFTYTPDANYNGPDSFTYRASEPLAVSNLATVSLTVTPVNDAPVATNDSFMTDEDTPLNIAVPGVLGNDTDVDNPSLTAAVVTSVMHGTLTLNPDGSLIYTPAANYNGPDSFTYRASDGNLQSNLATVNITVNAVNDLPVAVNDSYMTAEDTPLSTPAPGVLGNDTDVENDPFTAELVATTTHGTLVLNSDGSFTYTPAANYNGPDSFTYLAKEAGGSSNNATVSITVTPVNDTPVAVDDSFMTDEDTPLSVALPGILSNDTDVDGNSLSPILATGPAHGTLNLNVNGSFTYTPAANYNGPDNLTYRVSDGQVVSNLATVSITVKAVNDAPVAVDDSFSTAEDTPLVVGVPGVLGNDTDVENDPLTAAVATPPSHGTLTLNPDGSLTYTPAANYNGPDSFTYRTSDGHDQSNVATVSLTISAVNDAPVATDDSFSTPQDNALNVAAPGVLGNDTDADGDPLTAAVVSPPAHGALTFNPNGSFLYTPNAGFNGPDSFTYRAGDGTGQSNLATVNITVIRPNQAPVAGDTVFSAGQGMVLTVGGPGVLKNASDPDNDPLTAVLASPPAHGTLTLNPNGSFSYTPAAGFHGTDTFTVRASDGRDVSNVSTATIVVSPANTPPIAHEDAYTVAINGHLTVAAPGVLANDTDADNNQLFALLITSTAHGTLDLNIDGSVVYTPAPGFMGTDSFTYRASDVSAQSIPVLVTIAVGQVAPIFTAFALPDNDTGARDSYTRNNMPGFTGLATPGNLVQVQARRQGTNNFVALGQAVTGPDGQYRITSVPLQDGAYQFRVTSTRPGASAPEAIRNMPLLNIDKTPPRIAGVQLQPRQGRVIVNFTEALNTLNLATALNAANYQIGRILGNGTTRRLAITGIALQSPSQVLLTINGGQRLTSGRFLVVVGSGGIYDRAGNSLDGEFTRSLPSGNGVEGGNFRAQFTYNGVRVLGPLAAPAGLQIRSAPAGPLSLSARSRRPG